MFGKRRVEPNEAEATEQVEILQQPTLAVVDEAGLVGSEGLRAKLPAAVAVREVTTENAERIPFVPVAVLVVGGSASLLDGLLEQSNRVGYPLIVASRPDGLVALGAWLTSVAGETDRLQPLRLIVFNNPAEIARAAPTMLDPVPGPGSIRMPISPESEDTAYKSIYTISPQLKAVANRIGAFAENGVERIYLLGAPGAGKTSFAYYYWLKRGRGRFIAVNLAAESTNDKGAMKSLLCGHVAGAIPGTGAREGALSFAMDGVCFLDESHGLTGSVMQVLMEALDNNQFLPFGATNKRALQCAVIFASNRNWETLRETMHLDEHARLGAAVVEVPNLRDRTEDIIAVTATTLFNFSKRCKSWTPPIGLTPEAYNTLLACKWHGNTRTLIRVLEAAAISAASTDKAQIEVTHLESALSLWEPEEHQSLKLYASFPAQST